MIWVAAPERVSLASKFEIEQVGEDRWAVAICFSDGQRSPLIPRSTRSQAEDALREICLELRHSGNRSPVWVASGDRVALAHGFELRETGTGEWAIVVHYLDGLVLPGFYAESREKAEEALRGIYESIRKGETLVELPGPAGAFSIS